MSEEQRLRDVIMQLEVMATNMMGDLQEGSPFAEKRYNALDLAIVNLSAQIRPDSPCEWCKTRNKNRDIPVSPCANGDTGTAAVITGGGIVIFQHNRAMGYFDIKYCPNCGRRLEDEEQ